MKFRILNLLEPQVLLMRDTDEDGAELVRIIAWNESEDYRQEEVVTFRSGEAASRFIADFSEQAGIEFLERNNLR